MIIAIISAMDNNRVIGYKNQLPWHLPADLKHFKSLTLHKPVIMGRNTFLSIGKILKERQNIILTQDRHTTFTGASVAHSVEKAIHAAGNVPEIMVIGGAQVYQQTLPIVSRMYLTVIKHSFVGDKFFPEYDEQQWRKVYCESHLPDDKNHYPYEFIILERV